MAPASWHGSVIDAPGSEPFTVLGDVVVVVRTPRSRDFVSVEVAPASEAEGVALHEPPTCSCPSPLLSHPWQGEVSLHSPVSFDIAGASYRLTLEKLADSPAGPPWVVCDFLVERV